MWVADGHAEAGSIEVDQQPRRPLKSTGAYGTPRVASGGKLSKLYDRPDAESRSPLNNAVRLGKLYIISMRVLLPRGNIRDRLVNDFFLCKKARWSKGPLAVFLVLWSPPSGLRMHI